MADDSIDDPYLSDGEEITVQKVSSRFSPKSLLLTECLCS
jgi:GINS complex subunit 4